MDSVFTPVCFFWFRYGQPGYGYPSQYYGVPPYQQGMGFAYGNGQLGPPGQSPPLPHNAHGAMQGKNFFILVTFLRIECH